MSWQPQPIEEALQKIRSSKKRNFVESVEILVSFRDINLKDPSQRFNIETKVPHPIRKQIRLGLFAAGDLATRALNEEAITVISKDQAEQYAKEPKRAKVLAKTNDFFLAEREFMPLVGRYFGKVLGPRGKMPKPIASNVDIHSIQDDYARTVRLRVRENPCLNTRVATLDNSDEEITDNIIATLTTLQGKLPRGAQQIDRVFVKSTMSPAYQIT